MLPQTLLSSEPRAEIPELDTLRAIKFWQQGLDPFQTVTKHKRIFPKRRKPRKVRSVAR